MTILVTAKNDKLHFIVPLEINIDHSLFPFYATILKKQLGYDLNAHWKKKLTLKEYAVRWKCLEERFDEKSFNIKHVSTSDQLADILTRLTTAKLLGTLRSMIIRMLLIMSDI